VKAPNTSLSLVEALLAKMLVKASRHTLPPEAK
jgi:hypothetical protein